MVQISSMINVDQMGVWLKYNIGELINHFTRQTMIRSKGKYLLQSSLKFYFRSILNTRIASVTFQKKPNTTASQFLHPSNTLFKINSFSFSTASPSVAQLQKQAQSTKQQKGENSMQYLQKLHELSFAEAKSGSIQKAIQYYEYIVKKFEQNVHDKMSPALGDSMKNLQLLYKRGGKLMEFIPLTLRLLEIRTKQLGQNHKQVANEINQLGVAYYHIGNFGEAIDRYLSALRIREKLFGKDSLEVIQIKNNLATTYFQQGEHQKAKVIFEENIDKIKALPNFNEKLLLTPLTNLAAILDRSQNFKEALEKYQQIVQILKRLTNKNTYQLANIYHSMGIVCTKMNNINKAEEYHNLALKINQQIYGSEHPTVAQNYHNLGVCFQGKGQFDKSLEAYKKSIEIKSKTVGEDHPLLATTYNNMGIVNKMMQNNPQAKKCFEKVLEIMRKQNPQQDTSPIFADMYQNIGAILMEEQQVQQAMQNFEKAKQLHLKFFDEGDIKLAQTNFGMAQYNFMNMNYAEAHKLLDKCIESYEKFSPASPHLYIKYSMKASCYEREGDFAKTIEWLQKSIQSLQKNSQALPQQLRLVNTASLNYQIGDSYLRLKDLLKAKEFYSRAIEIFEKNFGQAYDTLVVIYETMAHVEKSIGNAKEALENFKKVDNSLNELLKQNINHPELLKKQQQIRKIISDLSK